MMSGKFAIFSPSIGVRSETFIKRHVEQLCPGKTVVITHKLVPPEEGGWSVSCPTYQIHEPHGILARAKRFVLRRAGFDCGEYVDIDGIKSFLNEHKVHTVLGQYIDHTWPFIRIADELGIRLFAHAHGFDLSCRFRDRRWRRRYANYLNAAGVIVVNQLMRERLVAAGVPGEKIFIIPCGVDIPALPTVRGVRERVNCLAVGRMVGKKAPLKLLTSFRIAMQQCPGLHLDYVGSGPLFEEVRRYVRTHAMEDKVFLHGSRTHSFVMDLMGKANIFLQHSVVDPKTGDEEGVPVAILEAMAAALPVVATRHAGIPEAVVDRLTGLLVDEGDVAGMAQNICCLAGDPELQVALGMAGRERVRAHYTWEREKAALLAIMGLDR